MPQLVGQEIGPIGYGLMGLTWRPEPCPTEQAIETMKAALSNGCNLFVGGTFYGSPEYNSSVLMEKYLEKYPEDANKIVLSIKGACGTHGGEPDGSPENIHREIDRCLKQMKGRKRIDVFEMARRDPKVPLKTTFAALQEHIDAGRVGGIAVSEVNLQTLQEAIKATKVVACEVEVNMFSRDIFTNGIAKTCAEHNIPIVAYSPMGRGILTGKIKSLTDIPENDQRRKFPWYQPENIDANIRLVGKIEELAKQKQCTTGQFAIAWVCAMGKRPGMPTIIPIPGGTTEERVNENSKLVDLTDAELETIDKMLKGVNVNGARYPSFIPMNT